MNNSDKFYWHGYIDFYEPFLSKLECENILEFGIFRGESIKWLRGKYENAYIYGCDILPQSSEWPVDDKISYIEIDQGNVDQIKNLFIKINKHFDLIIEDGSHIPEHQKTCLLESINYIKSGGVYILEDLQTSHPMHQYYKKSKKLLRPLTTSLHVLLAIEHCIRVGANMKTDAVEKLAEGPLFTVKDIKFLLDKISSINIYRRSNLPSKCFRCGSSDFDYGNLACKCGVDIYSPCDSMSAVIVVS